MVFNNVDSLNSLQKPIIVVNDEHLAIVHQSVHVSSLTLIDE